MDQRLKQTILLLLIEQLREVERKYLELQQVVTAIQQPGESDAKETRKKT